MGFISWRAALTSPSSSVVSLASPVVLDAAFPVEETHVTDPPYSSLPQVVVVGVGLAMPPPDPPPTPPPPEDLPPGAAPPPPPGHQPAHASAEANASAPMIKAPKINAFFMFPPD
jgi:hypothetical protein